MSKPCMGYPSRWQCAEALALEGHPPGVIAQRMGIKLTNVHSLLDYAKRKAEGSARAPRPAEANARTVVVSKDVLEALRPHAARRGISVNELARRILAVVADDGIVDGVLDDQDAPRPAAAAGNAQSPVADGRKGGA